MDPFSLYYMLQSFTLASRHSLFNLELYQISYYNSHGLQLVKANIPQEKNYVTFKRILLKDLIMF